LRPAFQFLATIILIAGGWFSQCSYSCRWCWHDRAILGRRWATMRWPAGSRVGEIPMWARGGVWWGAGGYWSLLILRMRWLPWFTFAQFKWAIRLWWRASKWQLIRDREEFDGGCYRSGIVDNKIPLVFSETAPLWGSRKSSWFLRDPPRWWASWFHRLSNNVCIRRINLHWRRSCNLAHRKGLG
jgi:hypothetical protein